MRLSILISAAVAACLCAAPPPDTPKRPKILGVAHIALSVADVEASRKYYKGLLGFGEPFKLDNADGSLSLTFIKVNDRQYIELFPEKQPKTDRLLHISIEVDDAEAMRAYLASKGIKVPATVPKGRTRNSNFMVTDPDGHLVEIVQYEPDGWSMREKGKFMDDSRISKRIAHLGIDVGKLEPAMKFYREVLGFQETWRGSREGKVLDWVNMRVPDGQDYIEFMLYSDPPSLARLGTMHHICLEVPDIEKSLADLNRKPARSEYTKPLEIRTGVNRKRQLNLFDPDGTRTELMEPNTVDGKPTPPSTAPPPH
jgi:catechol 2,3-dioxygenase-like lactoylglutathione lyase family enzyme